MSYGGAGGGDYVPDPPECSTDSDCGGGRRCLVDSCNTYTNFCECLADSDCEVDRICSSRCGANGCVAKPCESDDDCSAAAYCSGTCVSAHVCEDDSECTNGTRCVFPRKHGCEVDDAGAELPGCSRTKKVCKTSIGGLAACGTRLCAGEWFFPPCCTDRAENPCGVDVSTLGTKPSCQERNQPGVRDPWCPSAMRESRIIGVGCCRSDGFCGALADEWGLGCARLEAIGADYVGLPRRCGGANDGGVRDGATE